MFQTCLYLLLCFKLVCIFQFSKDTQINVILHFRMESDRIYEMVINMGPEQLLEKRYSLQMQYQSSDPNYNVLHALVL
jgi:hypothetical protein